MTKDYTDHYDNCPEPHVNEAKHGNDVVSEWQRVVSSDESHFCLDGDNQRICMRRHLGHHRDEWLTCVTHPKALVSHYLQPYSKICSNCVRIFKMDGMDYHRTPLETSQLHAEISGMLH